jgi:hypothetical protein
VTKNNPNKIKRFEKKKMIFLPILFISSTLFCSFSYASAKDGLVARQFTFIDQVNQLPSKNHSHHQLVGCAFRHTNTQPTPQKLQYIPYQ